MSSPPEVLGAGSSSPEMAVAGSAPLEESTPPDVSVAGLMARGQEGRSPAPSGIFRRGDGVTSRPEKFGRAVGSAIRARRTGEAREH